MGAHGEPGPGSGDVPDARGPGRGLRVLRALAWSALITSAAVLARSAFTRRPGDVIVYHRFAQRVAGGLRPYAEAPLEYPPYAALWLLWPAWAQGLEAYGALLSLSFLAVHLAVALWVLREGERAGRAGWPWVAVTALSVLPLLQGFWYLRRFDILAAALTLAAVVAAARSRAFLAGVAIAAGTLVKAYPIVIAPLLLVVAVHQGRGRRFVLGGLAGSAPALALALVWPWWRFGDLHAARGLQVESTAASLLWLGRSFIGWDVSWGGGATSYELSGGLTAAVLPWVTAGWVAVVAGSVLLAAWSVRAEPPGSIPALAAAALLPVLAFVAWGPVFSPQFMVWLQTLAVVALLGPRRWVPVLVLLAAALTPAIYPAPGYQTGLGLGITLILVTRNALLVAAWAGLAWAALRRPRSGG